MLRVIKLEKKVWWLPDSVIGLALYPFIFIRRYSKVVINHEKIHIEQQKELLVLPFYLLYIFNFLVNLVVYKFDTRRAYINICFEREAYENDINPNYINSRKRYSWLNYIKK